MVRAAGFVDLLEPEAKRIRNQGKKRKYLNKKKKRIIAFYFISVQSELDISVGHLNIWWHWYLLSSPFLFLLDIPVSFCSQPACLVTISSSCYMLKVSETGWLVSDDPFMYRFDNLFECELVYISILFKSFEIEKPLLSVDLHEFSCICILLVFYVQHICLSLSFCRNWWIYFICQILGLKFF